MEKLINSIPKQKYAGKEKDGKEFFAGFSLHYSTAKDKWVCAYGRGLTIDRVEADDPVEALAFFVELYNKNKIG